jgi:hypothetical protein
MTKTKFKIYFKIRALFANQLKVRSAVSNALAFMKIKKNSSKARIFGIR